jgi:ankyrin repeat protein
MNYLYTSFLYLSVTMSDKEIFFSAIRNGDLKQVEKLLEEIPKLIEARDQRGSTPLILATYYNHAALADFLIRKGAKPNEKDSSGNTALMGVCFKGFSEIANKLILAGADVNHSNSMGATCLIYAATFNRLEIAKLLLEHGANVKVKDSKGSTALDHAKTQGAEPLITLLEKYA